MSDPRKVETADEYRALLLSFVGSLTLCDHMGDVSGDVAEVLKHLGLDVQWDEWHELGAALHRMGVRTLYDTALGGDE
jgi:hypothetical protein